MKNFTTLTAVWLMLMGGFIACSNTNKPQNLVEQLRAKQAELQTCWETNAWMDRQCKDSFESPGSYDLDILYSNFAEGIALSSKLRKEIKALRKQLNPTDTQ